MITPDQAKQNVQKYLDNYQQDFFSKIEENIVEASSQGYTQLYLPCGDIPYKNVEEAADALKELGYIVLLEGFFFIYISWGERLNADLPFYDGSF